MSLLLTQIYGEVPKLAVSQLAQALMEMFSVQHETLWSVKTLPALQGNGKADSLWIVIMCCSS